MNVKRGSSPIAIGTVAGPPYNIHEKVNSAKLVAPWEDGGKTHAGKRAVVLGGASIVVRHPHTTACLQR